MNWYGSDQNQLRKWILLSALCIISFGSIHHTTHFFVGYYSTKTSNNDNDDPIHILITVCNGKADIDQGSTMVRYQEVADLLITIQRYGMCRDNNFTSSRTTNGQSNEDQIKSPGEQIIVHIFTDNVDTLNGNFLQTLPTSNLIDKLDVRVYPMPKPEEGSDYNKYRACASSRLYAPHLFEASATKLGTMKNDKEKSIDDDILPERVLYLDTDTLVTTQLRELWETFTAAFKEYPNALFAMTQECILRKEMGDYFFIGYAGENVTGADGNTHFVYTIPNGTCGGYNSGVMFAHLHRWRNKYFSEMVLEQESFAARHNLDMKFGDQGILNAMAARFPERLLEMPCYFNMRTDSMNSCLPHYFDNGGGILHGNRGLFHHNSAVKLLHDYLVRTNDTGKNDFLSKLSGGNDDDELFNDILLRLIMNDTEN